MPRQSALITTLLAAAVQGVLGADEPFTFCNESTCGDCPVGVTTSGTGYPNCVVYSSDDVFTDQGFEGAEGGGIKAFLDISQPDPGCTVILKSPAGTTMEGCGYQIASFKQPACAVVNIEETFMVQFCCGLGDCKRAGTKRSAKFSPNYGRDAAGSGIYLKDREGNVIQPIEVGVPSTVKREAIAAAPAAVEELPKRGNVCEEDSWKPDPGFEEYTRPAKNTQIVMTGAVGPGTVTITKTREQSWSTTVGGQFGFAEILSLGVDSTSTQEESISDSDARTFNLYDGQNGDIGFTSYLRCSQGRGTCNGEEVKGEICFPFNDSADKLAGIYAVVTHS